MLITKFTKRFEKDPIQITSTTRHPFETWFGYFPPSPLDVVYGKQGGLREDIIGEALKVEKFVDKIR
jgi:hypothetical protein